MVKKEKHGVGSVLPPPLFVIALFSIGFGLHWYYPISFQDGRLSFLVMVGGIVSIVFSGIFAFLARRIMISHGTPVSFSKESVVIVREGPFGLTRNPLYLSLALLFAGFGMVSNSLWFVPLLIVLIFFLYRVILIEEKYLEHHFGNEYLIYKKDVRRWI